MKNYTAQELWAMTKVKPHEVQNAIKKHTAFDAFMERYNKIHPYVDVGIDAHRGEFRVEVGVAGTF